MEIETSSVEPYLRIFTIYLAEQRYESAEAVLKEALGKNISDAVLYAGLGYLASRKAEYEKSVEYYSLAVEKEPENDKYWFYLAAAMDKAGRRKEAMDILEEITAKGTEFPEIYNYLGYMYAEEGKDLDKALTMIRKALEIEPENGAYLDSLGWAYYKKGMLEEAEEQIKKALEFLPDDPVVREHMGDVYVARGLFEQARDEWARVLTINPGNRGIREKLEALNELLELKNEGVTKKE
ncbi:MAG: tetratricopeptide repeat protein [Candidatus Omnitrophota bacterium]